MANSPLAAPFPGPGWSLVMVRRAAPTEPEGPPRLVDVLRVPVGQILVATRGWAGGASETVWDEMAWRPEPADSLAVRLDAAVARGAIAAWSIVGAGTQRSFVRARPDGGVAVTLAAPPTRVSLHGPLPGMGLDQYHSAFREHLVVTEEHMRLALAYRQTEVSDQRGDAERTFAGISEFWFASEADAVRMYADDTESAAVGSHAREFVAWAGAVTVCGVP